MLSDHSRFIMNLQKRVERVIEQSIASKEVAGVNVLFRMYGSELVYAEAGLADIEHKKPIRRDTIFRLFSMTKPVTAVAAMILFERGDIDLMQSVGDILPAYRKLSVFENGVKRDLNEPLLIQDLLNMTAGLSYPDGSTPTGMMTEELFKELDNRLDTPNEMTTRELADRLAEIPLDFVPGTSYRYSTCADVLGAVIEEVTGLRFSEFLKKEIFDRLGMEDTGFYIPKEKLSRRAEAYRTVENEDGCRDFVKYDWNNLGIKNRADSAPAFESGGAGLVSTIDDYSKFSEMLMNDGEYNGERILLPGTVQYMTERCMPHKLTKAFQRMMWHYEGFSYSNLMRICYDDKKSGYITSPGEYGWDGWLGTYFENFPDTGATLLIGTQKVDSGTFMLTRKIRNTILAQILSVSSIEGEDLDFD